MSDPRRRIPSVDALLSDDAFAALRARFGRQRIVHHLRACLDLARSGTTSEALPHDPSDARLWATRVGALLEDEARPSLRHVVNATGVVLHTNLGRAPLAEAALRAMAAAARGYCNLEYDLWEGARGSRYGHCASLLAELAGAEAALVVNNAAGGLLLALCGFARGRGVAVSRGELVEIGGGFRIPEILDRSGASLVEVGSTNRTRLSDYQEAVSTGAAQAILKVHRSNFAMSGFVEEASLGALSGLAAEMGVPLLHDLGSGLFVDPARLGLPPEPRASESIEAGADVVVVSGDKLFGGPQAGIVLGGEEAITRLRRDPLCRALRVDKATLAGLEATAGLYRDPERALSEIPTLRMLATKPEELEARARRLAARIREAGVRDVEAMATEGRVGGGTYPGVALPSWGVALDPEEGAGALLDALRRGDPAIVGRIDGDRVLLDLRTVAPTEEETLMGRVVDALAASAG